MEPIRITKDEAKRLVRKAYDAERLQAQGPRHQLPTIPAFKDSHGRKCAVGACFPEDHEVFEQEVYGGTSSLIGEGYLVTDDNAWFLNLQGLHDEWLHARREGKPVAAERHKAFAIHIGVGSV